MLTWAVGVVGLWQPRRGKLPLLEKNGCLLEASRCALDAKALGGLLSSKLHVSIGRCKPERLHPLSDFVQQLQIVRAVIRLPAVSAAYTGVPPIEPGCRHRPSQFSRVVVVAEDG